MQTPSSSTGEPHRFHPPKLPSLTPSILQTQHHILTALQPGGAGFASPKTEPGAQNSPERAGSPHKACKYKDLHHISPCCLPASSRAEDPRRASLPAETKPWGFLEPAPPCHPRGSYKNSLKTPRKREADQTQSRKQWKPERSGRQGGGSEQARGSACQPPGSDG